MRKPSFKVGAPGMKVLLWGVVLLIVMTLLGRFDVISGISNYQSDVLTLIAALFVATELGVRNLLVKRKGFTLLSGIGTAIVILAILGVLLSWLGIAFALLTAYKVFIDIALLIYVLIAIFS